MIYKQIQKSLPWLLFPDQILTHSSSCSSFLLFPDSESFSSDLIVSRCSLPHRLVSARRAGLVDQGRTDRKYFPGSRGYRDNTPLVCFDFFYFGRVGLESKLESIGLDFLESLFLRRQVLKQSYYFLGRLIKRGRNEQGLARILELQWFRKPEK